MSKRQKWTLEKIEEGIKKYFQTYEYYPRLSDFRRVDYLPSPNLFYSQFGDLPSLIEKIKSPVLPQVSAKTQKLHNINESNLSLFPNNIYMGRSIKAKEFKYTKECLICSKKFKTNIEKQVFCGEDCRKEHYARQYISKSNKNYGEAECPACGKMFIKKMIHHVFCSHNCAVSERFFSVNSNMHHVKEYIVERDDFTCNKCKKRFPMSDLHIHHITPIYKGGKDEEDNLITLCSECHRKEHNIL